VRTLQFDDRDQGEGLDYWGALDLENDGHQRSEMDLDDSQRAISVRGPGLTQQQKNDAVKLHNKLRAQEGASNMETLVSFRTLYYTRARTVVRF